MASWLRSLRAVGNEHDEMIWMGFVLSHKFTIDTQQYNTKQPSSLVVLAVSQFSRCMFERVKSIRNPLQSDFVFVLVQSGSGEQLRGCRSSGGGQDPRRDPPELHL